MVKEGPPPEIEKIFPKDVLPTVGFLSKLPVMKDEFSNSGIKSWEGKVLVNGSELTIEASFRPEIRRIDNLAGIKSFDGREIHISVSKYIGDETDDLVEYWTLLENPKDNQLMVFVSPCYSSSMLLPDVKSNMRLVLEGRLAVTKGKLDNADGFLTEKDIDQKKSKVNYWHYKKGKIVSAPLKEIFMTMGALKNAILSAKPAED